MPKPNIISRIRNKLKIERKQGPIDSRKLSKLQQEVTTKRAGDQILKFSSRLDSLLDLKSKYKGNLNPLQQKEYSSLLKEIKKTETIILRFYKTYSEGSFSLNPKINRILQKREKQVSVLEEKIKSLKEKLNDSSKAGKSQNLITEYQSRITKINISYLSEIFKILNKRDLAREKRFKSILVDRLLKKGKKNISIALLDPDIVFKTYNNYLKVNNLSPEKLSSSGAREILMKSRELLLKKDLTR